MSSCSSSSRRTRVRLVRRKRRVPVRRDVERVPGDDDRARPLVLPQAQEHVREADERFRAAVRSAHRLRQRVVRAVREGVAVDDEERRAHDDLPLQLVHRVRQAGRWRRAPPRPASAPPRSSSVDRRPVRDLERAEPRESIGAVDRRRHERHVRLERDPRRTRAPPCLVLLDDALRRRVPSGNMTTAWPFPREATRQSRSPRCPARRAAPGTPRRRR